MNSIEQLRSLVFGKAPSVSGTIVEVLTPTTFRVSTSTGSVQASATDGAAYRPGDEVMLLGNLIQGRLKTLSSVPVYSV